MADRNLRIRMLLEAADRFTKPLRQLKLGSRDAGTALKATRAELKALQQQQADVSSFRKLGAEVLATKRDFAAAQVKVAELARAIDATDQPTRKMQSDLRRAREEVSRLSTAEERQTEKLREVRARMREAGIEVGQVAAHERRLGSAIEATTRQFNDQARAIRLADEKARRFAAGREAFDRVQGRAAGLAAGGAAAIGTGVAMGAPLIGADQSSRDWQTRMTDIAQKADLSRRAAKALGGELLVAARNANQLPTSLQDGVDALAGFGMPVKSAVAMMSPIGRAATAYRAEIEDLSKAAFSAADNLKLFAGTEKLGEAARAREEARRTVQAIDIMAVAGKRGAFEVKDMAQYFPELTASMQGLKSKGAPAIADLAAALQITRKGAGDSGTAANNLQNLLSKINTKDTIENFEKMGIDIPKAMKKAAAEGRSPIEEIVELTRKATKGDSTKLAFLFGDMQVQQALRPLLENTALYRQIRADALKANGETERDYAEGMQDAEQRAKRLAVAAEILKLRIGDQLMPVFAGVRDRLASAAEKLTAFATRFPNLTRYAAIAAAVFAGLFLVLGGGAIVLAGMLAPFAAVTWAATTLGIALVPMVGIMAGVLVGVLAFAAAAYLIYDNWRAITGFFGGLWDGVQTRFAAAGSAITGLLGSIWSGVKAIFSMSLLDIARSVAFFVGYALGSLVRFGTAAYTWLTSTLPGLLASGWTSAWSALTDAFSSSWAWLTTRLPTVLANGWNAAWAVFKAAMRAAFVTLPKMFFDFGAMIIQGLWNGIKSAPGRLWNAGKSLAASVTGGFKEGAGIHSPSRVFMGLGGFLMAGLDRGIVRGQSGPLARARRLADRMAEAMRVSLPVPTVGLPAPGASAGRGVHPVDRLDRFGTLLGTVAGATGGGRSPAPLLRLDGLSRQIMAAIAVGSATPAIASAAARPPAQLAAAPTRAPAGPIEIHVHAAPGQSEQDLARMCARAVEDALARRDREEAARGRSSYADRSDI